MKGDIKFSKMARIGMFVFIAFVLIGVFLIPMFSREKILEIQMYI